MVWVGGFLVFHLSHHLIILKMVTQMEKGIFMSELKELKEELRGEFLDIKRDLKDISISNQNFTIALSQVQQTLQQTNTNIIQLQKDIYDLEVENKNNTLKLILAEKKIEQLEKQVEEVEKSNEQVKDDLKKTLIKFTFVLLSALGSAALLVLQK